MNYSALVTLIQDYCESTESSFVSDIPTFVQLAEERIYNSVEIPAIRKNVTVTMTASFQYFSLDNGTFAVFTTALNSSDTYMWGGTYGKKCHFDRNFNPSARIWGNYGFRVEFFEVLP